MSNKYYLLLVLLLSAIIGYLIYRINCKRKEDIIKLLIRRDLLPPPTSGTKWVNGGVCYMNDGNIGRVDGLYCMQIRVL
jgi:hypothetical protein